MKKSKRDFPYKISFRTTTEECKNNMMGIIKLCQRLGVLGASRLIGVVDEDKWESFLFDGDGNHKIDFVKEV